MAGLRERQKADRRRRIVEAAESLFHERSFSTVTIEEIAELAEVAPATVHNYYNTKGELLLALVIHGDEEIIRQGRRLVKNPPRDPVVALCRQLDGIATYSLSHLGKQTWRHVLATSMTSGNSNFGKDITALHKKLTREVARLLEALKARGDLPPDYDSETAAEVLYNVHQALFIELLCNEAMPQEQYRRGLRKNIGFVLDHLGARTSVSAA